MGFVLTGGMRWNSGYLIISILQIVLTAALVLSLPLWKSPEGKEETAPSEAPRKAMRFSEILSVPGAKAIMVSFFCYCAIEQTAGLWAASYLTLQRGLSAEQVASFASMFYLGITIGRNLADF